MQCLLTGRSFLTIGSISRPTLVSFAGKKRLFGEEAFAQLSSENTIALLNLMVGRSLAQCEELVKLTGRKLNLVEDNGHVALEIASNDRTERYYVTWVLGMFIAHLSNQIKVSPSGPDAHYCFVLPPSYSPNIERAYRDAAMVAGVDATRV